MLQALALLSAAHFEAHRGRLIGVNEELISLLPKEAVEGVRLPLDELRETLDLVAAGRDEPERTAKMAQATPLGWPS